MTVQAAAVHQAHRQAARQVHRQAARRQVRQAARHRHRRRLTRHHGRVCLLDVGAIGQCGRSAPHRQAEMSGR